MSYRTGYIPRIAKLVQYPYWDAGAWQYIRATKEVYPSDFGAIVLFLRRIDLAPQESVQVDGKEIFGNPSATDRTRIDLERLMIAPIVNSKLKIIGTEATKPTLVWFLVI